MATGTLILVFTDLENSTAVKSALPGRDLRARNQAYFDGILTPHRRRILDSLSECGGRLVETEGDGCFLVFTDAARAVQWGATLQSSHQDDPIETPLGPLRVRMGLHAGAPLADGAGFVGQEVDYAARVMSLANGGQIILSEAMAALVRAAAFTDLAVHPHGDREMKGIGRVPLYELLLPGRKPRDLRVPADSPTNLPPTWTPFVGREALIAECCDRIRDPATRLLALTGFGGIGKTRTAVQIARYFAGRDSEAFPDGVWWVPLETARSAETAFAALAHHLSLALEPQPSVREQVLSFLRDRRLLLVLDNSEQIPEAAEVLLALLRAGPHVRLLVTTRRATGLEAEHVEEIPPLGTEEAKELFAQRARTRRSGFAVTPENEADVHALCARLEGVPLALELAAARIAVMTPREILERLREPFRLLQVRDPGRPARQAALRAAMDWSYDLLGEEDRCLFAQISVFAGGFTLLDAEAICAAVDPFEGVPELQRHSLILVTTDTATQQNRYRMLETVREYAAEKLREVPEMEASLRARHAGHFLRFAEERVAHDRTPEEASALRDMEQELENLKAALRWADRTVAAESPAGGTAADQRRETAACLARLTLALAWFLQYRGFWQTALVITTRALELARAPHPSLDPSLIAALLYRQADLEFDMGLEVEAEQHVAESQAVLDPGADPDGRARGLNLLGLIARKQQRWAEAASGFGTALEIRRRLGDLQGAAACLVNLGFVEQQTGHPEAARALYEESRALAASAGDRRGVASVENNLGILAQDLGDTAAARRHYLETLRIMWGLGNRSDVARALQNVGEIEEQEGAPGRAALCYAAARHIFTELGSPWAAYSAEKLSALALPMERADPEEVIRILLPDGCG